MKAITINKKEQKFINYGFIAILIMLSVLMYFGKQKRLEAIEAQKLAEARLKAIKKLNFDCIEQGFYKHRAAIILSNITDECRTCKRRKLGNEEYMKLTIVIK